MKSFARCRVLFVVGLLTSSAVFVSGCTVDDNGLGEVEDGGPDGGEPDGIAPNADGGDATIEAGGEFGNAEGRSSAEAGDGSMTPGTDAEAAAPGIDASDAMVGDAEIDAGRDASVDTRRDSGASDGSGGGDADATNGSGPADAFDDVVAPEDAGEEDTGPDSDVDVVEAGPTATTTTSVITNALGSACADDAFNDGCLSPQCEDLGGTATSLCLATLTCALNGSTATPYCGLQTDETDECYCGDDVNLSDCQNGDGDGVCMAAEENGFGSSDPGVVTSSYLDTTTASGVANTITNCIVLNTIPSCLNAAGF